MGRPSPDTGVFIFIVSRREHDADHPCWSRSLRGVLGGGDRRSPHLSCPPRSGAVLSGIPFILIFFKIVKLIHLSGLFSYFDLILIF